MYVGKLRTLAAAGCTVGALFLGSGALQAVPLHEGLISYWPLSEGSGAIATDMATGGLVADNGTLRNSPTWVDGKFGAGLQFNGIDQDVLVPASSDMDINTNGVTLSAWVKLDQLPSEIAGGFSGIFDSAPDNYVLYLDKGNNELRFKATNAGGVSTVASQHPGIRASNLNTTDWIHVMGVYDGDNARSKIYFNGQLADVTSQANPTANLLEGPVRAGQISGIGSQPSAEDPFTAGNPFQGMISDVAVWNRALGPAEAQYLWNNGAGNAIGTADPNINPLPPLSPLLPSAQPVVYYKFDGDLNNSGTGGAALNATLHDVPGRNDNLFTPTNFGQGLNLTENPLSTPSADDPGDYLSVDYTLPESGTIATRFSAVQLANYVSLWSNSAHENNWEAWIYGDGRLAARATNGTPILAHNLFLFDDPTASHHYAFTWEREGENVLVRLFVNGEFVDERIGPWSDPGDTFFIAGGVDVNGASNHLGTGVFDEFRIYKEALTEAEVLYLSMFAPETVMPMEGDFNEDGIVDAADYTVWRDNYGTLYNDTHYQQWKNNFGSSAASGAVAPGAVPEPVTACFALLACFVGSAMCRFRRN